MDHSEVKHLPKVDHTPAELDVVSRTMLKAAALIEEHGLAKQIRHDYATGAMCVHGALAYAETGDVEGWGKCEHLAAERIFKALDPLRRTGCHRTWVAAWNNHPITTKEEVVAKLRAVALGG